MNPKVWLALMAAAIVVSMVAAVVGVRVHEADLTERCAAAGGRRVDVGIGERLCFGEDWRWIQI